MDREDILEHIERLKQRIKAVRGRLQNQEMVRADHGLLTPNYIIVGIEKDNQEIDQLEKEISRFEAMLGKEFFPEPVIELTRSEQKLISALTKLLEDPDRIARFKRRDLIDRYEVCCPPHYAQTWPPKGYTSDLIFQLIEYLRNAPEQPGEMNAFLKFIISPTIHENLSDIVDVELLAWVDQMAVKLDYDTLQIRAVKGEIRDKLIERGNQKDFYIMIVIAPDQHLDKFRISAWTFGKSGYENKLLRSDLLLDELAIIKAITRLQNTLCTEASNTFERIIIEYILSEELMYLSMAVDQLPIEFGDRKQPIGVEFEVNLRSYDRLYGNNLRWKLARRKWLARFIKSNQSHQKTISDDNISWIQAPEQCSIYGHFREDDLCVAFTIVPPVQTESQIPPILRTLLEQGVPVGIWPRKSVTSPIEQDLRTLAADSSLHDLPRRILKLRQTARYQSDDNHIGQHITLLWDTPYILPPDVILPGWS